MCHTHNAFTQYNVQIEDERGNETIDMQTDTPPVKSQCFDKRVATFLPGLQSGSRTYMLYMHAGLH